MEFPIDKDISLNLAGCSDRCLRQGPSRKISSRNPGPRYPPRRRVLTDQPASQLINQPSVLVSRSLTAHPTLLALPFPRLQENHYCWNLVTKPRARKVRQQRGRPATRSSSIVSQLSCDSIIICEWLNERTSKRLSLHPPDRTGLMHAQQALAALSRSITHSLHTHIHKSHSLTFFLLS